MGSELWSEVVWKPVHQWDDFGRRVSDRLKNIWRGKNILREAIRKNEEQRGREAEGRVSGTLSLAIAHPGRLSLRTTPPDALRDCLVQPPSQSDEPSAASLRGAPASRG